jgi:hypothetical protein
MVNSAGYEDRLVAFVDFLGFSEASREISNEVRLAVLDLLRQLVALRSDFTLTLKEEVKNGAVYMLKPAISTFSDNVVISYAVDPLRDSEVDLKLFMLHHLREIVSRIAAQALRLGFLIRGGATIGKLYQAGDVVFGEALVEAVELEKRIAMYPRIVLSTKVPAWLGTVKHPDMTLEDDGLYCVNYMRSIMDRPPGEENWAANMKSWFDEVVPKIQASLETHKRQGNLGKLAKWTWFAKRFRAMIEGLHPEHRTAIGVSVSDLHWVK